MVSSLAWQLQFLRLLHTQQLPPQAEVSYAALSGALTCAPPSARMSRPNLDQKAVTAAAAPVEDPPYRLKGGMSAASFRSCICCQLHRECSQAAASVQSSSDAVLRAQKHKHKQKHITVQARDCLNCRRLAWPHAT